MSFAILALRLLTLHSITQGKISTDGDKGEGKLMSAIEDLQQVCNEMVRYFHLSDVCSHHFVRVRSPYGVTQASKCSTIFPELLCPDKPLPTRGLLHSQYLATFPNPSVEPRTRRVHQSAFRIQEIVHAGTARHPSQNERPSLLSHQN